MFEREIRDFNVVPRWTTLRTITKQNVAEHSFFVTIYTKQIIEFLQLGEYAWQAITYALYHDGEETFSGDTPGPWKRISEDANQASIAARRLMKQRFPDWDAGPTHSIVKWVVKLANLVDEVAFLGNEFQMGNKNVVGVMANTMERVETHMATVPTGVPADKLDALFKSIKEAQRKHMFDISDYLVG